MATCEQSVSVGGLWHPQYQPCGKTAKVEVDGKAYCGIHDPERRQRTLDANEAKRMKCPSCDIARSQHYYKFCPHCGTAYANKSVSGAG